MSIFSAHYAQTGPSLLPVQYQGKVTINRRYQTETGFKGGLGKTEAMTRNKDGVGQKFTLPKKLHIKNP